MTNQTLEAISVTSTFTLTIEHAGKLSLMAEATGKKKSELIRDMIDEAYAKLQAVSSDN